MTRLGLSDCYSLPISIGTTRTIRSARLNPAVQVDCSTVSDRLGHLQTPMLRTERITTPVDSIERSTVESKRFHISTSTDWEFRNEPHHDFDRRSGGPALS